MMLLWFISSNISMGSSAFGQVVQVPRTYSSMTECQQAGEAFTASEPKGGHKKEVVFICVPLSATGAKIDSQATEQK